MSNLVEFFQDNKGILSAARYVVILGATSLTVIMVLSLFIKPDITSSLAGVLAGVIATVWGVGKGVEGSVAKKQIESEYGNPTTEDTEESA